MSNQSYGSAGDAYWISSRGTDKIYMNKLDAPPLALLDHGVIYEQVDGNLYFNDYKLTHDTGTGNVSGPGLSVANNICSFTDTTGLAIKDSGVHIFTDASKTSLVIGDNNTNQGDNQSLVVIGNDCATAGINSITNMVVIGNHTAESVNPSTTESVYIGGYAGENADGSGNTQVGFGAGDAAGADNTFIGRYAGSDIVAGADNICIGSGEVGEAADVATLRLGTTLLSESYIGGIYNATANDPDTRESVSIDANHKIVSAPSVYRAAMITTAPVNYSPLIGVPVVIASTSVTSGDLTYFQSTTNGQLRYSGTRPANLTVTGYVNIAPGNTGDVLTIQYALSNTPVAAPVVKVTQSLTGNYHVVTLPALLINVQPLDQIEFYIINTTSGNAWDIESWSIVGEVSY